MAGYKPKKYGTGAYGAPKPIRMAPSTAGSVTPLGISTRAAPKPTFKPDAINQALAYRSEGLNKQHGLGAYAKQAPKPAPDPGAPKAPDLTYNYAEDPILNQIQALSSQQRGDAQANALKLKKQLAIDYGDADFANSLGDPNTAAAAAGNPFSVRSQLKKGYETGVTGLEESLNNQNLFYGGHRAKELGDFANQYQGQLAGAAGQQQGLLGQIDQNLLAALMAADQSDILGQQNAQGAALGNALDYGIDPGAGTVAQALVGQGTAKKKKKAAPVTDLFGRQGYATPGGRGF